MKKNIIIFIVCFILFLLYYVFFKVLNYDEIWTFGFGYNVAKGLVPYRDFNLIITPLYPIISGIFLYIFGNNILSFLIFNAIISSFLILAIKEYKKDYTVAIIILFLAYIPNYNNMVLLLFYLILLLEKKNNKDFLIGIVSGILFFTKHNVGLFIFISSLLFLKKEKLMIRIKGFLIPTIFVFLYLLITGSFYKFIDYTFLGLFSFADKNTSFSIYFIFELFIVLILLKELWKKKFKDKELIYILMFQSTAFPIFDKYHILLSILPFFIYFLPNIKNYFYILFKDFLIIFLFFSNTFASGKFPNDLNNFNYRMIDLSINNRFVNSINYISNYKDSYTLFFLGSDAYLYKISLDIRINNYDIINYGNLGFNGESEYIKLIDETCKSKSCMFIIGTINGQTNLKIINYIKNNYKFMEKIEHNIIYTN